MVMKILATNRKARHEYTISDDIEAGLVLTGAEIKAIRAGGSQIAGSYAKILYSKNKQPELYLIGAIFKTNDPTQSQRTRKLLIHKSELNRLIGVSLEKGLTIIPLDLYLKKGLAKIKLGIGKGKKLFDKRETLKQRAIERNLRQKLEL